MSIILNVPDVYQQGLHILKNSYAGAPFIKSVRHGDQRKHKKHGGGLYQP